MLQSLRKIGQSWIVKALLSLLIISFGVWGVGDMFRGSPLGATVAKVGDTRITAQELEAAFRKQAIMLRQKDPSLSEAALRAGPTLDNTLDALIEQALVDKAVQAYEIEVSDAPMLSLIVSSARFKKEDGTFDDASWRQFLAAQGTSEAAFLAMQRKFAARNLLLDSIAAAPPPPDFMVQTLANALGQQRVLDVVRLNHAELDVKDGSDEELRTFYESYPAKFATTPTKDVTLLTLDAKLLEKDVKITDEEIKTAWEQRDSELNKPERRDIQQVLVPDEARARSLSKAIDDAQGDLQKAAREMSLTAVPLAGVEAETLPSEIRTAVFAAAVNTVTAPLQSPLGWHVIKVVRVIPGGKPPLNEVAAELRERLARERAGDMAAKLVNELDDALAAGRPLEDIADSMRLRLDRYAAVDEQGRQVKQPPDDAKENSKDISKAEGKVVHEFFNRQEAKRALAELNNGDTSQVIDDNTGVYSVLRVDAAYPAKVIPFADARGRVLQAWRGEEKAKTAAKLAAEIQQELNTGAAASKFAMRKGVEVRASKPITELGDKDAALPDIVHERAFMLKQAEAAVVMTADAAFVIRLAHIAKADPDAIKRKPAFANLASSLAATMAYDRIDAWKKGLRSRWPVHINKDALDNLKRAEN